MTKPGPQVVLPCLPPVQTAVAEAQGQPCAASAPASLGQGARVRVGRTQQQGALQAWAADPAQDSGQDLCAYLIDR